MMVEEGTAEEVMEVVSLVETEMEVVALMAVEWRVVIKAVQMVMATMEEVRMVAAQEASLAAKVAAESPAMLLGMATGGSRSSSQSAQWNNLWTMSFAHPKESRHRGPLSHSNLHCRSEQSPSKCREPFRSRYRRQPPAPHQRLQPAPRRPADL